MILDFANAKWKEDHLRRQIIMERNETLDQRVENSKLEDRVDYLTTENKILKDRLSECDQEF